MTANQTADERKTKDLALYLKEIGPSRAVDRFLSEHANARTKAAYAMELVLYMRWLRSEGVTLGWDDLPHDNLKCVFESGPTEVERKRTHMDWLRKYLNVHLMAEGSSDSKRKIASVAIREFYEANDSPLFGHLKEAEQKPRLSPKPLEPDDIRKVLLAMPGRFRTPLLVEWQSSIEINRVLELDWSFAVDQEPPVKVELLGRKRHKKPYSTYIGREAWEHLRAIRGGMPSYNAVTDSFHAAARRLGESGQLKNTDMRSWHTHYLRHVSGTPHMLALAANNQLVYTDHSSTGCVYSFNYVTLNLGKQWCSSGSNPDDVALDPTNTNVVWVSLYSSNSILKVNLGNSYSSYSLPSSCTEPEGLRVDSSGNVWVASQGCDKIFKFVPSTSTWSSCSMNTMPWYIALDTTNNQVWVAAHNAGSAGNVFDIAMSSCNSSTTGLNSGDSGPVGIDFYGHRVYVTFQGTNTVDMYNWAVFSWLCGPDSTGANSVPYGISHDSSANYWVALNGADKIAEGYC